MFLVYFPMAHMVWGKGGLLNAFLGGKFPASISPAAPSSTSLRASPRWSARSISGKRIGYPNEPMRPHSLVLSVIGACLLWVGWFGFNAGSASRHQAWPPALSSPRTSPRLPPRSPGCSPNGSRHGKPSVLGAISGARRGPGRHHSCFRFRAAHAGAADRRRRPAWSATSWPPP